MSPSRSYTAEEKVMVIFPEVETSEAPFFGENVIFDEVSDEDEPEETVVK